MTTPLCTDERFDINAIMRVSAHIRPEFKTLTFLERLELCGIWALMECIAEGHSDDDIGQMFDAMKARMLRQADMFRLGKMIAPALIPDGDFSR